MAQDFAGARLKEYRRIELIAKGSVSELFLAESATHGNVVVLKVTPAIRKETGVDQSMERFLQEFEMLREIRHPNIVRIYDLGVTDDHLFLAMEHFARGDLRKRMSEGLTARQSLAFARDLAYALQAIHEVGIFHRDLKPGNVMLRDDGSIALIDFGLAKHVALKMEVTDKGLIFGTPHYMSPEQGHGKEIDARSDLYALGVMLFEMLTGKKPFDAENHMAILVHHAKAPIPQLPDRLAALQPLIDTLMAKDVADRPPNAEEAARQIEVIRQSLDTRGAGGVSGTRESAAAARFARATGGIDPAAPTPRAWVDAALEDLPTLLVDHANCEKKAASTAMALIFAYPEDRALSVALSRLAREELKHFEQVERLMKQARRAVPAHEAGPLRERAAQAGAYARAETQARPHDRARADRSALVRAVPRCSRSDCRAEVRDLYEQLERSEARHFEMYLEFARARVRGGRDRATARAHRRARSGTRHERRIRELRFHSGPAGCKWGAPSTRAAGTSRARRASSTATQLAALVPRREHDALRVHAIDDERMHGRPMRVAVNQPSRARGAQRARHGLGIHVHDGRDRPLRCAPCCPRARRWPESRRAASGSDEESPLPAGPAHDAAQLLVRGILGAEHVAVAEQRRHAVQVDERPGRAVV